MQFNDILIHLVNEKRIRRASWAKGYNCKIVNKKIMLFQDSKPLKRQANLTKAEISMNDWELYEIKPI